VKKELRKQCNLRRDDILGIAVSGGKDSVVLLFLLRKILANKGLELKALTIDEGISGYRDRSISVIAGLCKAWKVEHRIIAFKDKFGHTIDEIAKKARAICSYCGVLRRYLLNKAAKELKANFLAMGHNLDDTAQSVLMNITRDDLEKFIRMAPHPIVRKGLVPRIEPLRKIPEKETYLYALLNGINFHKDECPYASFGVRNLYRKVLYELEYNIPGVRHAILNYYETIVKILRNKFSPIALKSCELCEEPTTQNICKACELIASLKQELVT
jgi:uncharacterized protein (TIGR00269 family)